MLNLLAEAQTAQNADWLLEIIKLVLPAVLAFLATLVGLLIWHHKKRSEPKYESLSYLNGKKLDGLMKAFSLLAYLTDVENPKTVIVWQRQGKQDTYYLRPPLAREYITKLSEMFYDDGYGLLLDRNVKELFYEYRGQLYGILLKSDCLSQGDERIELQNQQVIARLKEIYTQANKILRENLKKMEE